MAWAFATSRHAEPPLFDTIAAQISPRAEELKPQGVFMVAWAFATARVPAPTLFDSLAARSIGVVDDFRTSDACMTAWAFSTMFALPDAQP